MNPPEGFDRELGPGGLETRTIPNTVAEIRAGGDGPPIIEGLGSVYDQQTTIRGWFSEWDEEVAPGAWSKTIDGGDIRSMVNHDVNQLLGRTTSGSLTLEDRTDGLFYHIDVNRDDPQAMSAHAKVARGDIDGSSVWFSVIREEWTEPDETNSLERPVRRILEARLYEVGPVVFPAFPQTTSGARSIDAVLRAAGVEKASRRAEIGFDLITNPSEAETRIRELLDRNPGLRSNVCETAAAAPEPAAPSAEDADGTREGTPQPHLAHARARRLELEDRRHRHGL